MATKSDLQSTLHIHEVNMPPPPARFARFRLRGIPRECMAECFGTMVLIIFGDGVVAQMVVSSGSLGSALSIHLTWGLAVLFGILVSGGVSGAHLNPAVTIALAVFQRCPWKKVGPFIVAQFLGAFVGAFWVYSIYSPGINAFDNGVRTVTGPTATAGIFATYPADFTNTFTALWSEVFGTALLMGGIFAIGDGKNAKLPAAAGPYTVALLVMVIGMSYGMLTGYAINPARDFGPRVFTAIAGWGVEVFTAGNYYFWIPIVGPIVGANLGAGAYFLCIEMHHPDSPADRDGNASPV